MSDTAIHIENLGKRFRYGGVAPASESLRADLADWVKGIFRSNNNHHPTLQEVHESHIAESPEYFWALKDVNVEIKRGSVVGIIGRNGAGKSTLLKILSRITPPTTGKITYHGRVASLLEVGTGFHRELTGRENVFLNGSILGMKRSEIAQKFDEIVAFAEIDKFIDTPVKFYSSGMYVRLAFAVAAHLEPEIFVLDEVLAVGDIEFQRKCLAKVEDVSHSGRTVLFVSHNMAAVDRLCGQCVWLVNGAAKMQGPTKSVIDAYIGSGQSTQSEFFQEHNPDKALNLRRVTLAKGSQLNQSQIKYDESFDIVVDYELNERMAGAAISCAIVTASGTALISTSEEDLNPEILNGRQPGQYRTRVSVPARLLNEGHYFVRVFAMNHLKKKLFDRVDAVWFSIIGVGAHLIDGRAAHLVPQWPWNTERLP